MESALKPVRWVGSSRSDLKTFPTPVQRHIGQALYAAHTVRFHDAVYVLHAFQKKSKKGIATPLREIELVKQRLAAAERDYRERQD